jgi:hypothetical protein
MAGPAALSILYQHKQREKEMSQKKIKSAVIPQANSIARVVEVVASVAAGTNAPADLGKDLSVTARQGLYYRAAAESLKLIRPSGEHYILTGLGRRLLDAAADPYLQQRVLREAVMKNAAFRAVHERLRSQRGQSLEGLTRWLVSASELNEKTASRRLSSMINWLRYAGLAYSQDGRLKAIPVR